ncbi:MAG: gliding motility-associated-like protein [Spirosomataceae bacterium]
MVRLQNITLDNLRVIFTFIFLSFFVGSVAQNTPPPRPAVCDTPPRSSLSIGGDFSIVGPAGSLTNTICLEPFENNIKLDFFEDNPSAIGQYTVSKSYIQNIKNIADIDTAFKTVTSFTYTEGYYWTAQFGINASNESFYACKLISLKKRQPVTATIVTCGTSIVTVTIPSVNNVPTNNHSKYIIQWGDGFPPEEVIATGTTQTRTKNYTPTSPVVVEGNYTGENGNIVCSATQPALQLPNPANIIYVDRVEKKANLTDYEIGFKGFIPNVKYKFSYAVDDGAYSWIPYNDGNGGFPNGVAQVTDLDPAQDYCFKIAYVDNCGVARESNVVCSMSLKADVISDTQVDLEWNKPLSPNGIIQQNDLYKDELTCPTANCYNLLTLSSPLTRTHTFNGLKCSSVFTFQAVNIFTVPIGGGMTKTVEIISNTLEIDPASAAKPPKPVFPTLVSYATDINVSEVNFNIFFENPAEDRKPSYNFYRSVGGTSNFTLIGTDTNNRFIDTNVNPDKENYCYKYTYFDDCGNESEQSDAYCTIFLTSKSPNQLDWTQYIIPNVPNTGQVSYTIEFIDENGSISAVVNTNDLSESVAAIISSTNASKVSFRVLATQIVILPSGTPFPFSSRSNVYTFDLPAATFIPSAFTPNNDGINDEFKAEFRFLQSGSMIIYNRWGSIIFETDDLANGWDGTEASGSRLAPVGTYTYKIQSIGDNNEVSFLTGSVTLIR